MWSIKCELVLKQLFSPLSFTGSSLLADVNECAVENVGCDQDCIDHCAHVSQDSSCKLMERAAEPLVLVSQLHVCAL